MEKNIFLLVLFGALLILFNNVSAGPVYGGFWMVSPKSTTYNTTSISLSGSVWRQVLVCGDDDRNGVGICVISYGIGWSDYINYSIDNNSNETFCTNCSSYGTILTLPEGIHKITLYGYNSAYNIAEFSSSVIFAIQIPQITATTVPITTTTQTTTSTTTTTIPGCSGKSYWSCVSSASCKWIGDLRFGHCSSRETTTPTTTPTTSTTVITTTVTTTTISSCSGKGYWSCISYASCKWIGDLKIGYCTSKLL